eukprot:3085837-Rhodomonas_salina.3
MRVSEGRAAREEGERRGSRVWVWRRGVMKGSRKRRPSQSMSGTLLVRIGRRSCLIGLEFAMVSEHEDARRLQRQGNRGRTRTRARAKTREQQKKREKEREQEQEQESSHSITHVATSTPYVC